MPNVITWDSQETLYNVGSADRVEVNGMIAKTQAFTAVAEQEEGFSFKYYDCGEEPLQFAIQSEASLAEEWNKPEDDVYNTL